MAYTVIDLLDKFIQIEQTGYEMFTQIADSSGAQEKIKTLARIFAREEKRHMDIYRRLKEKMQKEPGIEVDFSLYDKASTIIFGFFRPGLTGGAEDERQLLETCLNFEKENLALALSVRGVLMNSDKGAESVPYKIMTVIVNEEQKHIKNIEIFLK